MLPISTYENDGRNNTYLVYSIMHTVKFGAGSYCG